jgi:hypothetical protein
MAARTARGKTPEERAAEVEVLAAQLTDAVIELTTSEAWVGMRGAKSFAVKAPVRRRLSVEEATERARTGKRPAFDTDGRPALVVRGFRLERVFRYEDTDGEPLPEAPEVGEGLGAGQVRRGR